jgi:hypothetical protein
LFTNIITTNNPINGAKTANPILLEIPPWSELPATTVPGTAAGAGAAGFPQSISNNIVNVFS